MMNIINVLKILLLFLHSSRTFEDDHKLSTLSSYLSETSGSNLTLHCNSNHDPILCLWKTSYGHVYTLSNGVLAERGRLAHIPWKGCAVEILGVQKRDSGKWECEVGVVIGDDFVTSTENIVLAITDKEKNKKVIQSTTTSTNKKSSTSGIREVGDDVIMHCSGTSGVVSLCRWKTPYHSTYIVGQGIYVERGRIQWRGKNPEKDCTIRISSLEMRDAGVWTCEIGFGGDNYNDLIIQTKDFRINIEAPLKLSTPTILTEKDQATLVCHANKQFDNCKWKTPYGSIFTFKDPQSSHENGRLSFYSFRSSKTDCGIMIQRLEPRDNGDWVCLVEANNNGKIHQNSSEILSLRSKISDNILDESTNNDYGSDLDYGYSPLEIDAIDYVNGDFDKVTSFSSTSSSPPFQVPFTSLFQKTSRKSLTTTTTPSTTRITAQTTQPLRRKISTTIPTKFLNSNNRETSKSELLLQRTPKTQRNYGLSNPKLNNPITSIDQIELKKLSTSPSRPTTTEVPSTSTTNIQTSFPHPFRTTSVIKSISSVYTPDKGRILVSISFKPTEKTTTIRPTILGNDNPFQESEGKEKENAQRKAIQRERERQRRLDKEKEAKRRREEERDRELKIHREKQEEELRQKASEDELRRLREEEEDKLRRKIEEEERRRKVEERLRKRKEEEQRLRRLKLEEEEKLRKKKLEVERSRRVKEEEQRMRRIKEEQDRLRQIKEEEERLKSFKEEQIRLKQIKEEQDRLERIQEEQDRLRRIKEEQDRLRRIKEEQDRLKRIQEEQDRLRRVKEEEERQRKVKEEEDRLRRVKEEEERQRKIKEEENRLRRVKEEEERQRKIEEEELRRRKDQERLFRRRKEQERQQQRRRKEQADELRKQKELELEHEKQRKEQEEALKKQKELKEEQERQKKEQVEELSRRKERERELQKRRQEQEEEIRRRKNQELRRRKEIEIQKRRDEQERQRKEQEEGLRLRKEDLEREKIIREHERRKKFDRKRLTNFEKERQLYIDQQQQLQKKERRQFEVNRRRKLRRERYKGIKAERRIQIEPNIEPAPSLRPKESTQASIGRKRIVIIDRDGPIGQKLQDTDKRRRFYLNEGNTARRRKKVTLEGTKPVPKIIKSVEMSTSVKSTVREEVRQVKEIRHVSKVITISPHHSVSHSHSEKNESTSKEIVKEVVNPFIIKQNIKSLIQSQSSTSPPPKIPVKLPNTEKDETKRECVITQPSNGNITCNGITPLDTIPPNEQCTLSCAPGYVSLEKDEAKCYHGRLTQRLECVKPDALLVMGGRSDTYGVLSSVELITAQGVCRGAVPSLPQMRWKLIVIAIGRDKVLACGGAGQFGDSKGDCWLMKFNPSPEWKETQSMKLPRDSAAVAFESNKVYVLGGSLGKLNGYTDVIDVYDPETEKWGKDEFHMTSPRHSHCAVGLGNGSIFVTGGYGGLSLAERFDIADNKWTALPELNPVRAQHGCALVDLHGEQGVIIVGGDSGGTRLGDVRFLSLKTSVWRKVAELNTARWGRPGVGVVGGRITVSAGWSGFRDLDTVEYYSEKTSAWRLTASRLQTERRWPYSTPISLSLFPKCIQKRSSG